MDDLMKNVKEIGARLKEMRHVAGKTPSEVAAVNGMSEEEYLACENGERDFSVTFLHRCARLLGVGLTDLLSGEGALLSTFTVCRRGEGLPLERRKGFVYEHLASNFKGRMTDPFLVTARYSEEEQNAPIPMSRHEGEEFDYILTGRLKVSVAGHVETVGPGDAVYYNSREEHGMIAVDGQDCTFLAMVIDPSGKAREWRGSSVPTDKPASLSTANPAEELVAPFVVREEDKDGCLKKIAFKNTDKYNFTRDILIPMAERAPERLALVYVDRFKNEKRYTFGEMAKMTAKTANWFLSLGIKKGDRVMLVLRRQIEFWFSILALQYIGAIALPATNLLMQKDFEYRFEKAGVSALLCTAVGQVAEEAEKALVSFPDVKVRVCAGGKRDGWLSFEDSFASFPDVFPPCGSEGNEPALMFFSSGTTGYPKIVVHSHTYSLGHYITGHYWHNVNPDGLHFTIADTGWGKALWGKLYGQWMSGCAVFVYDFEKFHADDILPMFARYNITTFCAPPTMYRFFIREDLSKYDLSSLQYVTTAGEALNPEVFNRFYEATGLRVMEGFGQTETTLTVANLVGMTPKVGSMGLPSPMYDVDIVDPEGNSLPAGKPGEIVLRTEPKQTCGVFLGYYDKNDPDGIDREKTAEVWHDGYYHTGDMAWRDEDGYFWYVGRIDDLIKSSGYRIGPFEIESVLMELPYVLECAVTGAPDEIRGQVVKATIILTADGKKRDPEELKKEIQTYVKKHTAPYKYPRIVEFVDELPKTISGKIRRVDIRKKSAEEAK